MVGSYTLYLFIYAKNDQNTYVVKMTGPYDYFVRIIIGRNYCNNM